MRGGSEQELDIGDQSLYLQYEAMHCGNQRYFPALVCVCMPHDFFTSCWDEANSGL